MKNKPILEKALQQAEPKQISEYFLTKKEKKYLRKSIVILIDTEIQFMLYCDEIIKQLIVMSRKLGLGQDFINELNDKLNS